MLVAVLGAPELIIIAVVVLLLFGPSKLPQLGAGVGKMLRGFKKEMKAVDDGTSVTTDDEAALDVRPRPALEGDATGEAGKPFVAG